MNKTQEVKLPTVKSVTLAQRECMSIIRNAIVCLEREQLPIFKETIELVLNQYYALKDEHNLSPKLMLAAAD